MWLTAFVSKIVGNGIQMVEVKVQRQNYMWKPVKCLFQLFVYLSFSEFSTQLLKKTFNR